MYSLNRIEIVGMFTALKALADKEDIESIKTIVNAVLDEAKLAKNSTDNEK